MKLFEVRIVLMCLMSLQSIAVRATGEATLLARADVLNTSLKTVKIDFGLIQRNAAHDTSSYLCAYNKITQQLYIIGHNEKGSSFLVKNAAGMYEKYEVLKHGELVWMKKNSVYAVTKPNEKNILQAAQSVSTDIHQYIYPYNVGDPIDQKYIARKSVLIPVDQQPAPTPANPPTHTPAPTPPADPTPSFFVRNTKTILGGVILGCILGYAYYHWRYHHKEHTKKVT